MGINDVVLLDSLVDKARERFGVSDPSEIFELFCFEQLLKDYELSYEELEAGWTDGPEDGGVDGFYVFVDGRLATDESIEYAAKRDPELRVVIFTVRRSDSFQQEPLNALAASLAELFDLRKAESDLDYPFADAVLLQRAIFHRAFVALADKRPRLAIEVYYCCRGDSGTLAGNLTTRAAHLNTMIATLFSSATVIVQFKGSSELLEMARRQVAYSLRLRFTESYISREGRNYVVLARLPDYYAFVSDEGGALRRYLFESNVRDYLGLGLVNRDIRSSLERHASPDTEDFWWLNNGVTILATHATVIGKELSLENVQIVNGLQTTETLHRYFADGGDLRDERAILLKIILTSDEDARARIIKATNYQSTVDLFSIRGLDKIQRDIEHFLADHGWFYDRRRNLYKNEGKPAERIVSIPYLAAAVRAVALGDPVRSGRQRARSLREDEVYEQVFNPKWDLRVFLASLEITHKIETVLQARKTIYETPPIALAHFVSYVYTCSRLGRSRYRPQDVAALVGSAPDETEVFAIRDELRAAGARLQIRGRRVEGVALSREFIDEFVQSRFGT